MEFMKRVMNRADQVHCSVGWRPSATFDHVPNPLYADGRRADSGLACITPASHKCKRT